MQANRYIALSEGEVLTLSEGEVLTLREGEKNHQKAYFRHRCSSLLLSNRGYKVEEIARIFEVRTHTVRFWMNQWETHGIAGLSIGKGRGRKGAICLSDVSLEEAIQEQVSLHPQSLAQVCEQLKQGEGVNLSKAQVKGFLKKKPGIAGVDSANA